MSRNAVLGHYPDYVEIADILGASRFSVPASLWSTWIATGQAWPENRQFLDECVRSGRIITTTPPSLARLGSAYLRELVYLQTRGYPIGVSRQLSLL